MKTLLLLSVALFFVTTSYAQEKFITKTGYAKFYSEAPLENIEAINNKVVSIIDFVKNEVVINVPIRDFQFDNSLMQEHFNENYMESDKFPSALFQGKLEYDPAIDLKKSGIYKLMVSGKMTIHGVTQAFKSPATIEVSENNMIAKTKFNLKVADFDIEIPTLVFRNIAEEVEVTVEIKYLPFKS